MLIYLALGSNITPRIDTISNCIDSLKNSFPAGFKASSLYETAPYQNSKQKPYINCCVKLETERSPQDLLKHVLQLELTLGRVRTEEKWDNRTIDIDIILFGNQIIQTPELTIPHYDISNRDFFIIPLLELNPELINPRSGQSFKKELSLLNSKLKTHPKII